MKKGLMIITVLAIGLLFAGAAFAATSDTVAVSAVIAAGTNAISVTEATINFGTVTPLATDHRFSAGPMTVDYFAANSPWTIRTSTNNSPGSGAEPEKAGLKGADLTTYMGMKIWDANFGGTGTPPDPEILSNWTGTGLEPWLRIPEADEQTAASTTWRRLAYTGAELATPFACYLGIEAQGVKAQAYSTVLTVEIIAQ